jgi:hypothetical protein
MRATIALIATTLFAMSGLFTMPGLANAATATPVGPLPRAFTGYNQPTIPATACRSLGPTEAKCVIPAMTAGRYLIEATGTSTSQGADAIQALEIDIGGRQCGVGKNAAPWPSGARIFRLNCEVSLLSDSPVVVRVVYADAKAVKDPRGPTLAIQPLPWNGVLFSQPFVPKQ